MRKTKTIGGNRGFVPYRPGSYRPFVPNSGPTPALEGEEEGAELFVCVHATICICLHVSAVVCVVCYLVSLPTHGHARTIQMIWKVCPMFYPSRLNHSFSGLIPTMSKKKELIRHIK